MKTKVKTHEVIIYALFIAIFKPYFIPTVLQQAGKCGIILIVLLFLFSKGKRGDIFNESIPFSVVIILSGVINFYKGKLNVSALFNGLLYAICFYCIYTVIKITAKNNSKLVIVSLYKITTLYCVLSLFDLLLPHTVDSMNLKIYLWGNKFTSSYLFVMWIAFYYIKNNNRNRLALKNKIIIFLLVIASLLYARIVECTTALISIFVMYIFILLQDKIKNLFLNTKILAISLFLSASFPFYAVEIMKTEFARKIFVGLLGENFGLSGRITLYDRYLAKALLWHPIFGNGYGTTVMFDYTGFFGNTQNGLLEIVYKFGVLGAFLLLFLVFSCFKKSSVTNQTIGAAILVYAMIVAGMVEVTFGWIFFYGISLVRWIDVKNTGNVYKKFKVIKQC